MPFKCFQKFIESISNYIKLYLKQQKTSFDIKKLQKRIVQDLDLKVDYDSKWHSQKSFQFNFKKWSPRPQIMNSERQDNIWKLFWREVANFMESKTNIIDIDEISISYKKK